MPRGEDSGVGTGIGFATARVLLLRVVDAWGEIKGRFMDDDDDDDVIAEGSASVRRLRLQQRLRSAAACSGVQLSMMSLPCRLAAGASSSPPRLEESYNAIIMS